MLPQTNIHPTPPSRRWPPNKRTPKKKNRAPTSSLSLSFAIWLPFPGGRQPERCVRPSRTNNKKSNQQSFLISFRIRAAPYTYIYIYSYHRRESNYLELCDGVQLERKLEAINHTPSDRTISRIGANGEAKWRPPHTAFKVRARDYDDDDAAHTATSVYLISRIVYPRYSPRRFCARYYAGSADATPRCGWCPRWLNQLLAAFPGELYTFKSCE